MEGFKKRTCRIFAIAICLSLLFPMARLLEMTVKADSTPVVFNNLTLIANDGSELTYGTAAGDYDVYSAGNILYINTNKAITVSGTTTTATLAITAGTHADVTLNGVSITNASVSPINVISKSVTDPTILHLTLADGSTNILNPSSGANNAGLHVTYGAQLIIDDSVRNPVDISGGRLAEACTVNGETLKAGDPAWKLDSKNPGALTVYSGTSASCIGGNNKENSGQITINGGNITVNAYQNGGSSSAGAGIGGGDYGGAGCNLDGGGIIINCGIINATASYHGAGIGAGWHANTAGIGHAGTVPGDITINGGYITSTGKDHGNAFGGACGSGNNVGHGAASTQHEIVITGGTLLPKSNNNGTQWDVGANGGAVIVTGGSFYPAKYASSTTGYSIQGAAVKSSDGTSLTMVTIDLSSYTYKNKDGEDIPLAAGDFLMSYKVTIDSVPVNPEYGLATKLDGTKKLYFWLPASSKGKTVAISDVILQTADGTVVDTTYPFTLPDVGGAGGDVTKRYVTFEVDEEKFSDELKGMLNKRYDGIPLDDAFWQLLNNEIVKQEIKVPQPIDGVIDDPTALEESAARLQDADGKPVSGDASVAGSFLEAGQYTITINYKKYATDTDFSKTFWGHQTSVNSIITRADTVVEDVEYTPEYQNGTTADTATSTKDFGKLTLTANVRPKDGEALTCQSPTGKVQFYINGVRVGSPVDLVAHSAPASRSLFSSRASQYNYSTATFVMDYTTANYLVPDNGDEFTVTAKYLGSNNYTVSQADALDKEEPNQFPVTVPPGSVITPVDKTEDDLDPDKYVDVEETLDPDKYDIINEGDTGDPADDRLYVYYSDSIKRATSTGTLGKADLAAMMNSRYAFINNIKKPVSTGDEDTAQLVLLTADNIVIKDKDGNEIDEINLEDVATYTIQATLEDESTLSRAVLTLNYDLTELSEKEDIQDIPTDVDTDGDGYPDINIDKDKDGKPDIDVDKDGDGKPDVNVDTDGDGKPDINIDTDDDGKPDVNVDTDGDGKPDVNVDIDGDNKPDINIVDKDGDGKPDPINPKDPDQDKTPDVNVVDKDGDGKPDDLDKLTPDEIKDLTPDVNIDTDGDGKPDTDVDTDGDGKPDVNVDIDGDGKPDINIVDKDGDGKPDPINPNDPNQDKTPDVNVVDKDGDGKPDDLDKLTPDEIKDLTPDVNVDTDGDGKPDVDVDVDGDGKPDVNIDTDGDGKPDINIVDKDGDGKPDPINPNDPDQDKTPDVNIDTDGDGKPDINIDTTGNGKPDINIDTDGDGKADINIDTDNDGKADINIDTDGDGKPNINIDKDGDGKADVNIDVNGDGIPDLNIEGILDTSDRTDLFAYVCLSLLAVIAFIIFKRKEENN